MKRYLSVVDAVISGEGNGPDAPDKVSTGLILIGTDPVTVDAVCARLMGFDWKNIPVIHKAFSVKQYPFCFHDHESITVESSIEKFNMPLGMISKTDLFTFKPSTGWKGHIELKPTETGTASSISTGSYKESIRNLKCEGGNE
jgi:hypothetical protein